MNLTYLHADWAENSWEVSLLYCVVELCRFDVMYVVAVGNKNKWVTQLCYRISIAIWTIHVWDFNRTSWSSCVYVYGLSSGPSEGLKIPSNFVGRDFEDVGSYCRCCCYYSLSLDFIHRNTTWKIHIGSYAQLLGRLWCCWPTWK
jgi:hypothetical protein